MIVSFSVDGWPFTAIFSGSIEIARDYSGNVAIRRVSDDALVIVIVDHVRLNEAKAMIQRIEDRYRRAMSVIGLGD